MVDRFLPNIRGLVAHELHERGESQTRIAALLGVTQARVSHYLSSRKERFDLELSKDFSINAGELESYAKVLAEDVTRSQADGIFTLYSIWKNLLFRGDVCSIHRRKSGIVPDCSVCMELHRPLTMSETSPETEDATILRDISEAVSLLENSSTFPLLMPEVSVNIAFSRADPKTSRDVAAIPGRLNKIHGRARAFALPEFGCSNHMSNVILIFSSKEKKLLGAMNLRYDLDIVVALSTLGIPRFITTEGPTKGKRGKEVSALKGDAVLKRLNSISIPHDVETPFAVIDRGSEGMEPNTYLIGSRASELAHCALKVSHSYATALHSPP